MMLDFPTNFAVHIIIGKDNQPNQCISTKVEPTSSETNLEASSPSSSAEDIFLVVARRMWRGLETAAGELSTMAGEGRRDSAEEEEGDEGSSSSWRCWRYSSPN
jgi:hypothetical protein